MPVSSWFQPLDLRRPRGYFLRRGATRPGPEQDQGRKTAPGLGAGRRIVPRKRPPVPDFRLPQARRRFGRWTVGSVALHGLLVLLIVLSETGVFAELFGTGSGSGPVGGGGGGGGLRVAFVDLPAFITAKAPDRAEAPRNDAVELRVPNPELKPIPRPERKVKMIQLTRPVSVAANLGRGPGPGGDAGDGIGAGGGIGTGEGTGEGSHKGPGTGGRGYVFAPEPRSVVYPVEEPPSSVKGQSFNIRFWVDARGRVTKVDIDPPIEDASFRKKLLESMYQWIFYPARTADGRSVNGQLVITHRP